MEKKDWKERSRDIWYMVGGKRYAFINEEEYIRVSDVQQEIDRAREEGKNWTNYQRGWDNALRAVGKFTKEHTSKLTK